MSYRRNTDETYRRLERAAATDPTLIPELVNTRKRLGLCGRCGDSNTDSNGYCPQCKITWDTGKIMEGLIEHLMEEARENGEEMSEREAERSAQEDTDFFNILWEMRCDTLTEWMEEINPEKRDWCVVGRNMGWRQTSGSAEISYNEASTGRNLLGRILPNTECTFTIYNNGVGLEIVNSHHDGNESYIITVAKYPCPRCGGYYCSEEDAKNCSEYCY